MTVARARFGPSSAARIVLIAGVLLGRAAGAQPTFQITNNGVGNGPEAVAVADFNGDGFDDLAVANADAGTVSIYLNQGGNGFNPTPSATLNGTSTDPLKSPQGIAVGDWVGNDGKPDIAVSNYNGASVSIFQSNGNGTFTQKPNIVVPRNPLGIAAGKFRNASPNLDLVVATNTTRTAGSVTVLLGNGDGTFATYSPALTVDHPRRLVVGDFGSFGSFVRDGNQDIAVTANGSSTIAIFYGNGAVTQSSGFSSIESYATAPGPIGITAADFNNDGVLDIATVCDGGSTSRVLMHFGRTSGSTPGNLYDGSDVVPNPYFNGNANIFDVKAVQLNSGSKPDLVATLTGTSGTTNDKVVLLVNNTPDNTFTPVFATAVPCTSGPPGTPGDAPKGIAVGSFNAAGDAIQDWAVANRNSDNVSIFTGDGVGASCPSSSQVPNVVTAKNPVAMVLCDVTDPNGTGAPDTAPDIVVIDDQGSVQKLMVFANDDLGNFQFKASQNISTTGTSGSAIACGDRNGDGKKDIILTNDGGDDNAVACLNNGNGTFNCSVLPFGSGVLDNPGSVAIDDFDGTGTLDVCVGNVGNDTVKCLLSSGAVTSIAVDAHPVSLISGTFNATFKDVVAAPSTFAQVDLLTNSGGGSFSFSTKLLHASNKPVWVTTADVNSPADGKPDVVTANKGAGTVEVLVGGGGGAFSLAGGPYAAGGAPNSAAVADFDLDGKPDVMTVDSGRDKASFLKGNGNGTLVGCTRGTASCEYDAGDGAAFIQAGNLNLNDACPDVAVLDLNSGGLTIMLNTSPGCTCSCPPCPQ